MIYNFSDFILEAKNSSHYCYYELENVLECNWLDVDLLKNKENYYFEITTEKDKLKMIFKDEEVLISDQYVEPFWKKLIQTLRNNNNILSKWVIIPKYLKDNEPELISTFEWGLT